MGLKFKDSIPGFEVNYFANTGDDFGNADFDDIDQA
jgi:hypothetical protein